MVCVSLSGVAVVSGNGNDWMAWLMFGIGIELIVLLLRKSDARV